MRHKNLAIVTIVGILISTIVSCTSTPPVRLFVIDGGQQYFVRPSTIKSKELTLALDFTIRKTEAVQDVTMNATLDDLTDIAVIRFDLGGKAAFEITDFSLVFSRIDEIRRTGPADYSDFKHFTEQVRAVEDEIVITVTFVDGRTVTLTKTRDLREKLATVPPL